MRDLILGVLLQPFPGESTLSLPTDGLDDKNRILRSRPGVEFSQLRATADELAGEGVRRGGVERRGKWNCSYHRRCRCRRRGCELDLAQRLVDPCVEFVGRLEERANLVLLEFDLQGAQLHQFLRVL